MAQGKAMKDRTEADSEGLHYHFNFKNSVFLKTQFLKVGRI